METFRVILMAEKVDGVPQKVAVCLEHGVSGSGNDDMAALEGLVVALRTPMSRTAPPAPEKYHIAYAQARRSSSSVRGDMIFQVRSP